MNKSFLEAMKKAKEHMESLCFMIKTRKKPTYFTRKSAKMSFIDAIYFMLRKNTKTMQLENS